MQDFAPADTVATVGTVAKNAPLWSFHFCKHLGRGLIGAFAAIVRGYAGSSKASTIVCPGEVLCTDHQESKWSKDIVPTNAAPRSSRHVQ